MVTVGIGVNTRTFDLATWATFTIVEDVNVDIEITSGILFGDFHTRIFNRTLNNACPSPSPSTDMYVQFSGREIEIQCLPPGDYAIQVLSSSGDPNILLGDFDEAWNYGLLGTLYFTVDFTVFALPPQVYSGLMPGNIDPINNMNALQEKFYILNTGCIM